MSSPTSGLHPAKVSGSPILFCPPREGSPMKIGACSNNDLRDIFNQIVANRGKFTVEENGHIKTYQFKKSQLKKDQVKKHIEFHLIPPHIMRQYLLEMK